MAGKRGKGAELSVFSDRAGRANAAIFDVLVRDSPLTIKQLLKKISRYEGLEETYYASLTKRLRNLQEAGFIEEIDLDQKGTPASYRLCIKALLAMFLKENSIQNILNQATDRQSAKILLVLLDMVLGNKK